jgi:glycosyltransferase involved in cell wall biosynthesis
VATLSAVIPATDGRPTLQQAVRAVETARAAPEELIVVDRPAGLGPAAARNLGARRASGEVIVFIDADVEVHADAFERIRAAFEEDAELAAVFGSYDDDPGGDGLVSDFRNLLHHYVHQQGAGPAATFWAGLGAIRREALLELGGFDEERYPRPSIEDVELGARLFRKGGRILLDPGLQGKHLKTWTLPGMVETDLLDRGVPWLRMMLADRSHSSVLNLGWRHRIGAGAAVALIAALVRRNFQLAAVLVVLLLAIDGDFYGLLWRRRGARLLAAGIPLHLVHRLTSVAAVPVALTMHLFGRSPRRG